MIADNFPFIFPHMTTMTTTEEFKKCNAYLRKETKLSMEQLLPGHRQRLTSELILRFGRHNKRVQMGVSWLAANDNDFKSKRKSAGKQLAKEDLAAFIQPKFLGVLGHFDQRLTSQGRRTKF